jgi:hypothetical protein
MEWSEFVMFVIEQVVQDKDFTIFEKFDDVNHHAIQPPASRQAVQCSKVIPELNRLFVGVGPNILIYNTNNQSETWLTEPDTLVMQHKGKKIAHGYGAGGFVPQQQQQQNKEDRLVGAGAKVTDDLLHECIDIAFLPSKDLLFVLRSDLCVEFHRLTSRTSFLPENMEHCGFWHLKNPHYRLQIRDIPDEPWRLFIIGNTNEIESWLISVGERGHVEISDPQLLTAHTDYVRDILIIYNESYSLLVSGGMDKKVMIWDLKTLTCKGFKSGHTAGVQCLAYDGRSTLFAGGFDYSIIGWDLDAQISKPIIFLHGHEATISRIRAVGSVDRCISLDYDGELKFWDVSRANPNDSERHIANFSCVDDHIRVFEIFSDLGSRFPTSHGVITLAQGRRQHVLRISDYSDKISPPLHVFLSTPLLMCISVHTNHIAFWSAVTGHEQNIMKIGLSQGSSGGGGGHHGLATEVTSAVLDDRGRKLIIGDSNGHISVYNGLTAAKLKTFPALPYAIRYLLYTSEKTIIAIAGAGDLHIFDELPTLVEKSNNEHNQHDLLKQVHLREVRAHEADVVAITYSAKLGLIATADCAGCLVIWNYEFLSVELILNGFIDGDIGQLAFLDPLPLLAVTCSTSVLTLVPVSSALKMYGRVLWRVQMCVQGAPELAQLDEDIAILEGQEAELELFGNAGNGLLCGDDMMNSVEGSLLTDNSVNIGATAVISEINIADVNGGSKQATPHTSKQATPRTSKQATPRTSMTGAASESTKMSKKISVSSKSLTAGVVNATDTGGVSGSGGGEGGGGSRTSSKQGPNPTSNDEATSVAGPAGTSTKTSNSAKGSSASVKGDASQKVVTNVNSSLESIKERVTSTKGGVSQKVAACVNSSQESVKEHGTQSLKAAAEGGSVKGADASAKAGVGGGDGDAVVEEVAGTDTDADADEESADDDGSTGSISKLRKLKQSFSNKRIKEYLQKRHDARSIAVEIQSSSVNLHPPVEDIIATTLEKILNEKEAYRLAQLNIDEYDEEMRRKHDKDNLKSKMNESYIFHDDLSSVPLQPLPADIEIHCFLGFDDGTMAIYDLTRTIKSIGIGMIPSTVAATTRQGYNARRTCFKMNGIKYSELMNFGWSTQDIVDGSRCTVGVVKKVWHPHSAAVTSLSLTGGIVEGPHGRGYNDILTGSDDYSIQLWKHGSCGSADGYSAATAYCDKGILTRGHEFDKLFRPRWKTPFNMKERAIQRKCNAEILVQQLDLTIREKKRAKDTRRQAISQARKARFSNTFGRIGAGTGGVNEGSGADGGPHKIHESIPLPTMEDLAMQREAFENRHHHQPGHLKEHLLTDDPDYIRAVGQLAGKVTYHVSHRDVARTESLAKFNDAKKAILRSTSTTKKKGKKGKRRGKQDRASLLFGVTGGPNGKNGGDSDSSSDDDDEKRGSKYL